ASALRAVTEIEEVRFSIGPAYPHRGQLESILESAPWRYQLLSGLPNLIGCYRWCDLALIAGGLTMWEVCCVGTPAIAVCQPIDHQLELADRLTSQGAMATLGYGTDASEDTIARMISEQRSVEIRQKMSDTGPVLIDGLGTVRVAEILLEISRRASSP